MTTTDSELVSPEVIQPEVEVAPESLPADLISGARVRPDARGLALTILATVALLFALQWAQEFLIPLVFGILIAYTLNPLTVWLERIRIPRVLAVMLVMAVILGGAMGAANSLRSEFQSIVEQLPAATQKLSKALIKMRSGKHDALEQMQAAATEIERAAGQAAGAAVRKAAPVVAASPPFSLSSWLWASSIGAMVFVGQVTMVMFLVFFLLPPATPSSASWSS